jgi:hypothetical protein
MNLMVEGMMMMRAFDKPDMVNNACLAQSSDCYSTGANLDDR